MWPFKPTPAPVPVPAERESHWSTHGLGKVSGRGHALVDALLAGASKLIPAAPVTGATDSTEGGAGAKAYRRYGGDAMSDVLAEWYGSQTFIGYQMAAILAQHWLIDKVCTMPARDAVRNGFERSGVDDKTATALIKADKRWGLRSQMVEFVRMGRIFGIRIAIFQVDGIDYEAPFNIDGVTAGSYRGITQVDPYWTAPDLDAEAASNPAGPDFYEPTWWTISGKRYHKSHLHIFRTAMMPDLLKPVYQYGGPPIPQRIMERVYAAERTANEAPQLAMTKRLNVYKTDMAQATAADATGLFSEKMAWRVATRDNYGVNIIDNEEDMTQLDTSLTDLDDVIMSQYQMVAAGGGVPATKLLGTTPKGFNATGAYEESSYHEELETIQTNDLTALVERHTALVMKSEGLPGEPDDVEISWHEVDAPTAEEVAGVNKTNAETDKMYVDMGAIDGQDVRDRIRLAPDSGYNNLTAEAPEPEPIDLGGIDPLTGEPTETDPDAPPSQFE